MRPFPLIWPLFLLSIGTAQAGGTGGPSSLLTRTGVLRQVPGVLEVQAPHPTQRMARLRVGGETVQVSVVFGQLEGSASLNYLRVWGPWTPATAIQRQALVTVARTVLTHCGPALPSEVWQTLRTLPLRRWEKKPGWQERTWPGLTLGYSGEQGLSVMDQEVSGLQATWNMPAGRERCTW